MRKPSRPPAVEVGEQDREALALVGGHRQPWTMRLTKPRIRQDGGVFCCPPHPPTNLYLQYLVQRHSRVHAFPTRIVWDEPKQARNLKPEPEGHGLDFDNVETGFDFGSATVAPTKPSPDGRPRFLALGFFRERLHALVFSPLGSEAISLISFRPASTKERKTYDEGQG